MGQPVTDSSAVVGCLHCGLATVDDGSYCCLGCELAHQVSLEAAADKSGTKAALTLSVLLSMSVMMLSLFLYAEDVYEATDDATFVMLRQAYRIASAVLATPVLLLLGRPLWRRALRQLFAAKLSMELLVGSGSLAAYVLSLVALWRGDGGVYFDTAVAALLLATFGRYLEAQARRHASSMLGPLLSSAGQKVLAGASFDALVEQPPAELEPGAHLEIAPEQALPVDATVCERATEVNLSVLTGEIEPLTFEVGALVAAGAVPTSRPLRCIAVTSASSSTLARLEELTRTLRENRGALGRVADGFASLLVPLVWGMALSALAFWTHGESLGRGIEVALAVVLVACPCTYGVLTPLLLWLSLRRALRHGVCIRHASALERLSKVQTVAFDKTGTLTTPATSAELSLTSDDVSEGEAWSLIAGLERGSRHPLGAALAAEASQHADAASLGERELVAGRGVRARDGAGRRVAIGSALWVSPDGDPGQHSAVLIREGEVIATIDVGEQLRAEAPPALEALRAAGIDTLIVSGDRQARVDRIGDALGMAAYGDLGPAAKVERIRELAGHSAVVGDGLNDAPALADACSSIAVQGATTLSRGIADVVLLEPDLTLIPWTLALARRTVRMAWRVLTASTLYNVCFLALAAAGLLKPVWAGLSMLIASLLTLAAVLAIESGPSPAQHQAQPPELKEAIA